MIAALAHMQYFVVLVVRRETQKEKVVLGARSCINCLGMFPTFFSAADRLGLAGSRTFMSPNGA